MRKVRGPFAWTVVFAVLAGGCAVPDLDDYEARPLAQTSFMYAADGSLITTLHATEDRVVLGRSEMVRWLREATVAIEDRRFYQHHGIDPRALGRAAVVNLSRGEVIEGGSTITQQLVKNLYVGDAVSLRRKWDEAALAWQLEDRFTKEQILNKYLNTVYFGEGAYGAQAAARTYFGVDAAELTLGRSALLAGLISAPSHFDPYIRPRSAIGRRAVVLRLMREQGLITAAQRRVAAAEPVVLRRDRNEERHPYPYFVDHVKRWFMANPAFGRTRGDRYQLLFTGGLRITTTLDPRIQAAAQTSADAILSYPGDPDAAVTVLDPRTGYIRAMVGGNEADYWADRRAGRVNLATGVGGTGRQTGSAFKPYALVAALEHGISPDSMFAAPATLDIALPDGGIWPVTNAGGVGYGTLSLRSATIDSVNTVYAQVMQQITPEVVIETAERMGMRCCVEVAEPSSPLVPHLSAVLGANEANTLEMASAYGTLATGGQHVDPVPVITVSDAEGNVLWQASPRPAQVVSPQVAAAAVDILHDVVLYGTGTAANIGRPQIGKTGTDDDHANAWYVGAVPQLSAAVWVGFQAGQIPMEPPRTRTEVLGGTWPAQIWRLLMLKATAGLPPEPFPTPEARYVTAAVDVSQEPACLPNAFTLPSNIDLRSFLVGTEPTAVCTTPTELQDVVVPSVIGRPQPEAMSALRTAGFYVRVELTPSTQPEGTVVYQDPIGGAFERQTETITITVATALAPSEL
ncbi:MAG: transglycosylase domain-containing protein [Actinomycetota bacterium]